jgi:hypothetical protein
MQKLQLSTRTAASLCATLFGALKETKQFHFAGPNHAMFFAQLSLLLYKSQLCCAPLIQPPQPGLFAWTEQMLTVITVSTAVCGFVLFCLLMNYCQGTNLCSTKAACSSFVAIFF